MLFGAQASVISCGRLLIALSILIGSISPLPAGFAVMGAFSSEAETVSVWVLFVCFARKGSLAGRSMLALVSVRACAIDG